MTKGKSPKSISLDEPGVYARPRWRHASRIFGAIVVIVLNIMVTLTAVNAHMRGATFSFTRELPAFILVIFCDLTILLPIVCEVDMAKVTEDYLVLKTTFYNRAIPWSAITDFRLPLFLVFSYLKVGRCFYLINKRQIRGFDQLAQAISARTGFPKPKA